MGLKRKTNGFRFILICICVFSLSEAFANTTSELNHVAVIADGNRRWAKERNLPPSEGHREGFLNITPKIIEDLWDMGIHTVTIWGFSTANYSRSESEVANLMHYFDELLKKMLPIAKSAEAKIIHLGRKDRLLDYLLQTLNQAENATSSQSKHVFNFAIDYGGKDELIRACQKIRSIKGSLENLTEEEIDAHLDTAQQPFPSPDLIIRTSGELRLSGFMPWQSVYSELYFIQKYYPALDRNDLEEAVQSFGNRRRSFGK